MFPLQNILVVIQRMTYLQPALSSLLDLLPLQHQATQSERCQTTGHTLFNSPPTFSHDSLTLLIMNFQSVAIALKHKPCFKLISETFKFNKKFSMKKYTGQLIKKTKQKLHNSLPGLYLLFSKGCQEKIASASMSAAHFPRVLEVPFLRPKVQVLNLSPAKMSLAIKSPVKTCNGL